MDERSNQRVATGTTVECSIQNRTILARIWDLSMCGCKLHVFDAALKEGDRLAIAFEMGIVASGSVAWQKMGYAGIRFDIPLHEAVVRHLDVAKYVNAPWFELPNLPHPLRGIPAIPDVHNA